MTSIAEAFWKADRVVSSCETFEHIKLAKRYLFLLAQRIPKSKRQYNSRKLPSRLGNRYNHFKFREDSVAMSRLQNKLDAKKNLILGI